MEFSSYSSYSFSLKGYTMALSQTQVRDRKQLFYYNVIYLYRLSKLQSGDIKIKFSLFLSVCCHCTFGNFNTKTILFQ